MACASSWDTSRPRTLRRQSIYGYALTMELAHTHSHFVYEQALYGGVTYRGTWLPNSPEHQAALDAEYRITPALAVGAGAQLWTWA